MVALSLFTTNDGHQVSIDIIHIHIILTRDSSSTNARFIESLGSEYKSSIGRVHESRANASDDEDEDALFAELEAELENADSAALRDRGTKEVQAQLRRFSSLRSLNCSIDQHPRPWYRLEKVQTMQRTGYGQYAEIIDEKEIIRMSA